jgi:hypothetical protein
MEMQWKMGWMDGGQDSAVRIVDWTCWNLEVVKRHVDC